MPYPNTGYLGWQWVGPGYKKKTYLSNIKEDREGPIFQEYVGPVFDKSGGSQIGFASDVIQTAININFIMPKYSAARLGIADYFGQLEKFQ